MPIKPELTAAAVVNIDGVFELQVDFSDDSHHSVKLKAGDDHESVSRLLRDFSYIVHSHRPRPVS